MINGFHIQITNAKFQIVVSGLYRSSVAAGMRPPFFSAIGRLYNALLFTAGCITSQGRIFYIFASIFYVLEFVLQKKCVSLHRHIIGISDMNKTKLISVRVDEETLSVIDNATRNSIYASRSDAINGALRLIAAAIERGFFYKILMYHHQFDEIDSFEFEYHPRK